MRGGTGAPGLSRCPKIGNVPKVSQEYMQNRRSEIVEVARSLFARSGYQQASMSEIIAATGLSAGAIYNHFSSKTELMSAAARVNLDRFTASSDELPWDFVERCLRELQTDHQLTRFFAITWGEAATVPEIAAVVDEQLGQLRDRVIAVYRRWAEAELDLTGSELETWLDMLAAAVLSVFTGFVMQSTALANFDAERYFEFSRTILRQG